MLAQALPLAVKDGADLAARGDLLYGAYLAGTAFGVAGAGLHHKICHVLGGRYGLPHAQTHAIVLPYVMALNLPGAPDAAARISQALGEAGLDPAARRPRCRPWPRGWACPAGCATSGCARTRSTRRPGSSSRPCPRTTRCRPGRPNCARCCAPPGPARRWPPWPGRGPGDAAVQAAREAAVTAEVLASFAGAASPRYREVAQSLVRNLHAFAREIRLTQDEWQFGIDFLTRAGHITDDRRQEFILLSDVLGLSMLTIGINAPASAGATESTVVGPFFVAGAPETAAGRRHRGRAQGPVPATCPAR